MKQRVAKFRKMGAVEEKKSEVPVENGEPRLLLAGKDQLIDFKNNSLAVNASTNGGARE
jgi:hypothetical protein